MCLRAVIGTRYQDELVIEVASVSYRMAFKRKIAILPYMLLIYTIIVVTKFAVKPL